MNLVSLGVPTRNLRSRIKTHYNAMPSSHRTMVRYLTMGWAIMLASLLSAEPALAQTNLESFGQSVLNLLSNGLLRTVAILAIIAAGFGWLTGRVNTGALVTVIIGIALIFSAPWIVDQLNAG